jgi:hypothetical protein
VVKGDGKGVFEGGIGLVVVWCGGTVGAGLMR